jgi:hypothetical protein
MDIFLAEIELLLAEVTRILPPSSGALAVLLDREPNSAGPLLLQPIGRPRQQSMIRKSKPFRDSCQGAGAWSTMPR